MAHALLVSSLSEPGHAALYPKPLTGLNSDTAHADIQGGPGAACLFGAYALFGHIMLCKIQKHRCFVVKNLSFSSGRLDQKQLGGSIRLDVFHKQEQELGSSGCRTFFVAYNAFFVSGLCLFGVLRTAV